MQLGASMPPPPRYTTSVRRSTLLAASLGITTLLAGGTALGGPPGRAVPKRAPVTYNATGGNITIIVQAPQQQASDEKPDEKPSDKRALKLSQNEPAAEQPSKEDPADKARKGIVLIERAGELVGMGTVLANDGRVLTALSPLGDGNNLDVIFPDGSTSKAKLNHSERLWDLALLSPVVGKWPDGLAASSQNVDDKDTKLLGFAPIKGKPIAAPLSLKGRKSFFGADETLLSNVFELGTKVGPKELGGPIVDDNGDVIAMIGRACMPIEKGPCAPTPFGVPLPALKSFIGKAPPSALQDIPPAPWLGLQGTAEKGPVQGVRVQGVAPGSPAEEAGLRGGDKKDGDVIVALDGEPMASPEALAKQIQSHAVGDRLKMLLFNNGKYRESTLVLRPAPKKLAAALSPRHHAARQPERSTGGFVLSCKQLRHREARTSRARSILSPPHCARQTAQASALRGAQCPPG